MSSRLCARRAFLLALLPVAALPTGAAAEVPAVPAAASVWPRTDWDQMRIEVDGVSLVLPRPQAQRLADLMLRAAASPAAAVAATGPAIAQFEAGRGAEPVGVLSLHGDRWRWAAAGDAHGARTLQVDPALSQALLQEAQRLLHR